MPIYVSADSVEVWTKPQLFKLDSERKPLYVAGVPADNFSADGQLWGNPIYDWPEHEKQAITGGFIVSMKVSNFMMSFGLTISKVSQTSGKLMVKTSS